MMLMVTARRVLMATLTVAIAALQTRAAASPPTPHVGPAAADPVQPGRAAIDAALDVLYPKVLDHRWAILPGPGEIAPPLTEVVAYRSLNPTPHWHYITYGLSGMGAPGASLSRVSGHSGFGIELTLRLADRSNTPPTWPINFLRWIAAYVRRDKHPPGDGHSMPLMDHMLDERSPGVAGVAFTVDRELGMVKTDNGSLTFLQVVPLTADEHALIERWDAVKLLQELELVDPKLLWHVGRTSILRGPRGAEIARQAARDGSSMELEFDLLSWDDHTVVLDSTSRRGMVNFLRYRVAYGRTARIQSTDKSMTIRPGRVGLQLDREHAVLSVPAARATALADQLEHATSNTVVTFDGAPLFRMGDLEKPN